jgi:hypothetical protein
MWRHDLLPSLNVDLIRGNSNHRFRCQLLGWLLQVGRVELRKITRYALFQLSVILHRMWIETEFNCSKKEVAA